MYFKWFHTGKKVDYKRQHLWITWIMNAHHLNDMMDGDGGSGGGGGEVPMRAILCVSFKGGVIIIFLALIKVTKYYSNLH